MKVGCFFLYLLLLGVPGICFGFQCLDFYDRSRVEVLRNHRFETSRDLYDYMLQFGPRFQLRLKNLVKGKRWWDIGAGLALAQRDWLRLALKQENEFGNGYGKVQLSRSILPTLNRDSQLLPELMAVSFAPRTSVVRDVQPYHLEKFEDWGEHQNDHLNLYSGHVDLITDYFGNLSYTRDFQSDLMNYLRLLAPDGALYLTIEDSTNFVQSESGRIPLMTWLSSQAGLRVRPVWTLQTLIQKYGVEKGHALHDGDSYEIILANKSELERMPELISVTHVQPESGQPYRLFKVGTSLKLK